MKKIFFVTLMLATTLGLKAQLSEDLSNLINQELKIRYKAFIYDFLDLNANEQANFDNTFNEYLAKKKVLYVDFVQLLVDYADGYNHFSDKDIMYYNKALSETYHKQNKLNKTYFKKFKKILPLKKTNNYFLVDRFLRNEFEAKALDYLLSNEAIQVDGNTKTEATESFMQ